ncbi:MAG: transcription antitermination factor NusB [Oligoflexia bacterium]|nr:transcription antitermination factor NusB [Oligoflexia bacterium]
MKSRRQARETALQALYQCDALQDWSGQAIDIFFSNFGPEELESEAAESEMLEFSRALTLGTIQNLESIDRRIAEACRNWSLARMSRVDRNILRLAAYEMAFVSEIPQKVSINEALEIAKRFGAPDSPNFINGVLDKVASGIEAEQGPPAPLAAGIK